MDVELVTRWALPLPLFFLVACWLALDMEGAEVEMDELVELSTGDGPTESVAMGGCTTD